jgi:CubicO group peptidase (beta-lactamase class C family)
VLEMEAAGVESVERVVVEQLATWEVPGCAVAAVRGGRVELVGGWGLRDREAGLPVTQDTLFAIGVHDQGVHRDARWRPRR